MNAARPQAVTDQVAADIARHRAAVDVLAAGYRSALTVADPLAAFAGVAGTVWQSMTSSDMSHVIAAAVQVIVEMQDAAAGPADDFAPVEGPSLASIHRRWLDRGLPASTWPDFLAAARRDEQADRAGVDRHWGPLAATGGDS